MMENRIRHWRRLRGLSQESLGRMVGLGKPTISKLERGGLRLRDVTIAKLVDALGVPAEELLGDYAGRGRAAGGHDTSSPRPAGTEGAGGAGEPGAAHQHGGRRGDRGMHDDGVPADETDFGFRRVPLGEKAGLVREVFARVAPRYDLMNDLMSAGIHRLWKADMVDWLRPRPGMRVADVAGGTGDIAFRILARAQGARVTVCDVNPAMIDIGRDRALDRGITEGVDWLCSDAERLPLADGSMDALTIAFGIRNVTLVEAALAEARRVLKPGGRFLCLEFSQVVAAPLAALYDAYSFRVLPAIGAVVAGDRDAYRYLVESIRCFPDQERFAAMIADSGLGQTRYRNLSGGVAALHSAWRL